MNDQSERERLTPYEGGQVWVIKGFPRDEFGEPVEAWDEAGLPATFGTEYVDGLHGKVEAPVPPECVVVMCDIVKGRSRGVVIGPQLSDCHIAYVNPQQLLRRFVCGSKHPLLNSIKTRQGRIAKDWSKRGIRLQLEDCVATETA